MIENLPIKNVWKYWNINPENPELNPEVTKRRWSWREDKGVQLHVPIGQKWDHAKTLSTIPTKLKAHYRFDTLADGMRER